MKKHGFTLVELTISIALLSVVMIFLLKFLVLVKKEDEGVSTVTDMELDKSIISKTINEDVLNEGYISSFTCNNSECSINLKSGKVRTLSSIDNTVKYIDTTNNKVLMSRKTILNYSITSTKGSVIDKIILVNDKSEYNIEIISSKI